MSGNNKVFNYNKLASGKEGWETFKGPLNPSDVSGIYEARENPRVSIPSPFARIELMREAFEICSKGESNNSIPKRDKMLVSQALDILELLFEGPERQGIQLTAVNLQSVYNELKSLGSNEYNMGMGLLGKTLERYGRIEKNGMSEMGNVYILRRGPHALAMTCPTSLVMPSPNYKEWTDLTINGNIHIFTEIRELYQRDKAFIKYLYLWRQQPEIRHSPSLSAFNQYLQEQEDKIHRTDSALYDAISNLPGNYMDILEKDYQPVSMNSDSVIKIFGIPFYHIRAEKIGGFISSSSDLALESKLKPYDKPLVLSSKNDMENAIYTGENVLWNSNDSGLNYADTSVKKSDVSQRSILPNGVPYEFGYLYEHDFLEDYIFQLPYPLNDQEVDNIPRFFTGNVNEKLSDTSFIPPITSKYFEYFTLDDLKRSLKVIVKSVPDTFEPTKRVVSSVVVRLTVPVKGGNALLVKEYFPMGENEGVGSVNSAERYATGQILKTDIAINIYPFVRLPHEEQNNYIVQLLRDSNNLPSCRFSLSFTEQNREESTIVNCKRYVKRTENGVPILTNYSIDSHKFDRIHINIEDKDNDNEIISRAILLPGFGVDYQGNKEYEFGFDFGTSNTYVAVREKGTDNVVPFVLPVKLLVSTIDSTRDSNLLVESFEVFTKQDLFPWSSKEPFPIASVIAVPQFLDTLSSNNEDTKEVPFLYGSIPFLYGTEDYGRSAYEIKSGLKWSYSNKKVDSSLATSFINELVLLAQGFAITKQADLKKCELTWTYPLSMNKPAIKKLQGVWEKAFKKYFIGDSDEDKVKINRVSESFAPALNRYEKFTSNSGTALSIDIGGGTCDIVLIPDGKGLKGARLTSIGYGADCIFGIEEKKVKEINLIKNAVAEIKSNIEKAAANQKGEMAREYMKIAKNLQSILNEDRNANEASGALFNLTRNEILKNISDLVSYNLWLKGKSFYHNIFQYYYAALVYFLVKLCEYEGCTGEYRPETIYFSGSGSKMLDIIDSRNAPLEDYTTSLFNFFSSEDDEDDELEDVEIKKAGDMSKQITALGAIPKGKGRIFRDDNLAEKPEKGENSVENKYKSAFKLLKDSEEKLRYGDLGNAELIDVVSDSIVDFHKSFAKFIEDYGDEYGINPEKMEEDFLNISDKKIHKLVRRNLNHELSDMEGKEKEEYQDTPFFKVIKAFIRDVVAPD